MLSQKTIDIVKSTAPILDEYAEILTGHFYKRMFSHNPEVIPFFNSAHQESGVQQKALAGAICAYAANIDNLAALSGAVELIAQKHSSLMVKAEHYPIVGSNLLASIREVLGEGATNEVIDAWAEAYEFLADILIKRETQIYKEHTEAPNGWEEFSNFRVVKKEKESDIITSFYLVPLHGGGVPKFKPGQYITVRVPTPCGHTTMRNYSLSDKPGQEYFRISVKREISITANIPKGFVSNYLHDNIDVGSVIEVGGPCGEFFLDINKKYDCPLVLLAAGIGITPILSIAKMALEAMSNRKIILIHACLHENVQAFHKTLDAMEKEYKNLTVHYCYSELPPQGVTRADKDTTGVIDTALMTSLIPERYADYYFCGPKPFMTYIHRQLIDWKIPMSQCHFEFFGPQQELEYT